uniref:Uncharacterized protein n=1 Tax=Glossina pallidipes TaxID=7398 RepID=A0A1A9ZGY1_GLOPL
MPRTITGHLNLIDISNRKERRLRGIKRLQYFGVCGHFQYCNYIFQLAMFENLQRLLSLTQLQKFKINAKMMKYCIKVNGRLLVQFSNRIERTIKANDKIIVGVI